MVNDLKSLGKQLSEKLQNDPDGFIRGLAASIDPKALHQAVGNATKLTEAYRDGTWLKQIVLQVAKEAMERDDLSERDKKCLARDTKEFEICIDQLISGHDGKCDRQASLNAIESAMAIAALDPTALKAFREERTVPARAEKIRNLKTREKEIADAFRKVAGLKGLQLKAGEKYIEQHFSQQLGDFLPKDVKLPSNRKLREIVSKIKRGQL